MARSVTTIYNTIINAIASDPILGPQLTSVSQTAIFKLISYIIAVVQNTEEVNNDTFVSVVENIVNEIPPATAQMIQQQAFLFQYSATNPQIIQFATSSLSPFFLTPYYPTVNTAYQIISNCSVSSNQAGYVNIKVATGGTSSPVPLSTTQLSALQSYFTQVKPSGLNYNITSVPTDRLYFVCVITAQGAYSGTLTTNLLSAYNSYLSSIPFGGSIKLINLLFALMQVPGMVDIKPITVVARPNSTPFGGGTVMVSGSTIEGTAAYGQSEYTTIAGYITDEVSPNDFLSNLAVTSRLNYI
jgi:hypothetical protein